MNRFGVLSFGLSITHIDTGVMNNDNSNVSNGVGEKIIQ